MIKINEFPMMSKDEYESIQKLLLPTDVMLEYGAGSSTLYFSKYVKNYVSIEHDFDWYNKLKSLVNNNVSIYHGECFFTNNHEHCDYEDEENKEKWRSYFEMVHKIPEYKYDKILIDGRARAYCALEVYNYLKDDGLLFIHDYTNRPKYHAIVEDAYLKISSIDSLALFKKRSLAH